MYGPTPLFGDTLSNFIDFNDNLFQVLVDTIQKVGIGVVGRETHITVNRYEQLFTSWIELLPAEIDWCITFGPDLSLALPLIGELFKDSIVILISFKLYLLSVYSFDVVIHVKDWVTLNRES